MDARLTNWNFADEEANSTPGLINRQKSARNLIVLGLNDVERRGRFLDPERNIESTASLEACDCRDFLFVGKATRKSFQPCKHIYRLAMELGVLEPRYWDHAAREAQRLVTLSQQKQREEARLRALGRDGREWGGWPAALHRSGLQLNRQYRAYFIVDDEEERAVQSDGCWHVHEYQVQLDSCNCPDFMDRRLPCKHIYAVALLSRLPVALSRRDYLDARGQDKDIVFEFPVERADPLSRL